MAKQAGATGPNRDDGIPPDAVQNPKEHGPWTAVCPQADEEWSLALGRDHESGRRRVGIRWNAYVGKNTRTGYPNQGRGACWFVLPEPIGEFVLAKLGISG